MAQRVYLYTADDPDAGPFYDRAEAGSLNAALRVLFAEGARFVGSPVFADRTALAVSRDRLQTLVGAGSDAFDAFWQKNPPRAWLVLVPDEVMSSVDAQVLCSQPSPGSADVIASLRTTRWSTVLYYSLTPDDEEATPEVRAPEIRRGPWYGEVDSSTVIGAFVGALEDPWFLSPSHMATLMAWSKIPGPSADAIKEAWQERCIRVALPAALAAFDELAAALEPRVSWRPPRFAMPDLASVRRGMLTARLESLKARLKDSYDEWTRHANRTTSKLSIDLVELILWIPKDEVGWMTDFWRAVSRAAAVSRITTPLAESSSALIGVTVTLQSFALDLAVHSEREVMRETPDAPDAREAATRAFAALSSAALDAFLAAGPFPAP